MTANTRLLIHHQSHLSSPSGESENHFHGSDDGDNTALQNLPFTKKLFDMLSDSDNTEMIVWNRGKCILVYMVLLLLTINWFSLSLSLSDGLSFEVLDPKGLERDVLPKYFRHSRFQSLVRQLNFYNFKVRLSLSLSLSLSTLHILILSPCFTESWQRTFFVDLHSRLFPTR